MAPITHIKKGRVLGYKQLWIYKDKKGKNASRIIEYLFDSTENYKKGQVNLKSYTGLIVIKDWEDEYIGGFLMQNGQTTGAITAFGYEKPTGSTPKSGKTASGFACGFQTSCSTRWVETPPSGGAAIGSASNPPSYVGSPSGYYATVCETNYICVYEESTGMGYPSNGSSNNPGTIIVSNFENLWGTSGGSPSSGTPPSEADVFFNQMAWAGVYFSQSEKNAIGNNTEMMNDIREYHSIFGLKPDLNKYKPTFIMTGTDQILYPKFTEIVKHVRIRVLGDSKILNALKEFTSLDERRIKALVTWGLGPTVVVKQLTAEPLKNWNAGGYNYGVFNPKTPNLVYIDQHTVSFYEKEQKWPELEKAWAVLLCHVLIHESAHYGVNTTQKLDLIDGPPGPYLEHRFDLKAFGYPALPDDVIEKIVLQKR